MNFWEVLLLCPTCKGETTLKRCFYSASGEFHFQAYCEPCQQMVGWKVDAVALKYMAHCADEKAENKVEENPSQKPKLQKKETPYLTEKLSDEDKLFLKKWNIKL